MSYGICTKCGKHNSVLEPLIICQDCYNLFIETRLDEETRSDRESNLK